LLGARPTDTLELAGPMPARVASALGLPSRDAFLTAYRDRTAAVRAAYDEVFSPERAQSQQASSAGHLRPDATAVRAASEEVSARERARSQQPPSAGHPRPDASKRHPLQ